MLLIYRTEIDGRPGEETDLRPVFNRHVTVVGSRRILVERRWNVKGHGEGALLDTGGRFVFSVRLDEDGDGRCHRYLHLALVLAGNVVEQLPEHGISASFSRRVPHLSPDPRLRRIQPFLVILILFPT